MSVMNFGKVADYIIEYSFYLLFFLVPIIWLPINFELFEFNKMILTYILTVVIAAAWVIKILINKDFKFRRTPLDWLVLIFLVTNLLSTIFSRDIATSVFGYYSRFNGGLLSILAYTILYFALTNNFDKRKAQTLLIVGLISAFFVSVYAILEHPNPLFATVENGKKVLHGIDYKYWAEAVEFRVFSTLGQPNWLAAYLAMLLPISLSYLLIAKKAWQKLGFLIAAIAALLAFTFTLSRGGTLGLVAAAIVFFGLLLIYREPLTAKLRHFFHLRVGWPAFLEKNYLWLGVFLIAVIVINAQFGNAFALRKGFPKVQLAKVDQKSGLSQLDTGGDQTSQIRLIVWKGALDIFKHYPLLGTGVETFGYSYYSFRPAEHNQTSEWDYLYNKAHNEYLNFLANNGLVGFISYLALILAFLYWGMRYLIKSKLTAEHLLILGLFAGYAGYLVQNFFGFSVVIIAIFFFLFPALAFIFADETKESSFPSALTKFLTKTELNRILLILNLIVAGFLLVGIGRTWLADTYYAQSGSSDPNTNYQNLKTAIGLQPFEPTYRAELAASASLLAGQVYDEKLKEKLIKEAVSTAENLTKTNPHHTFVARFKLQTYYSLSQLDTKYLKDLVRSADDLAKMAPTEASVQYNVAVAYWLAGENEKALKQINQVLKLKPDYPEAKILKEELTKPGLT